MTISASEVTVTTSATALASADADLDEVLITNTGVNDVYVGPSGVATTDGFPVASGGVLSITLPAGETIYGIVASGTETCRVLTVDA